MDFNVDKQVISVCEQGCKCRSEQAVDTDVALPEYLPDIVRIVRCDCTPGIKAYQTNGDRITAECVCCLRVLYVSDRGELCCYEQNIQFTKQLEADSQDTRAFFVGAKTDYMNYRVSGQRRFELHGAVTVYAESRCRENQELISDACGDGITLNSEKISVSNLVSNIEKTFTVTETCDAGALSEPAGAVIACSAAAIINQQKIVSGKIFLSGDLIVYSVFSGAESRQVQALESSIGINQIIDAPDITEDCHIDSSITVSAVEVKPRADSDGSKNLLDITATLSLSVCGYEDKEISLIGEAYSVTYEAEVRKEIIRAPLITGEIEDTFLCRGTADLSTTGVSEVLSFMLGSITAGFSVKDGSYSVTGEIETEIIYRDAKGEICFAERYIPYEYTKPTPESCELLFCTPHCTVCAKSFVISEASKLDVRAEINVRGLIFRKRDISAVTHLAINRDKIKTTDTAALTVYFADKGEVLWNIAEKYNTTVERIVTENKLTDTTLRESRKLLISKM